MTSAIPDAIDPFLLVFMENAWFYGGIIAILCGIGALFKILTLAV